MKQFIILLILALGLTNDASSQITKNNWIVGGSGTFSHSKTTFPTGESISSRIDVNPRVGYFIADHFALGIFGSYGRVSEKINNNRSSYSDYGIGPFLRYYFLAPENRTNLLIETTGVYNEQKNSLITAKSRFITYSVLAGPAIFFNSSVGLELLLGYKGYSEQDAKIKNNSFHFNIGLQIYLEKDK